ncbi:MAG: hypothetical protein KUG74_14465, partial [Rhodobacteraceae bacterium]|nr:hypothetical protein [Paracoccaceae bacterium]
DENDRAVLALEDGFLVQQARKAFANGADQFEGLSFTSESGHVLGAFDEVGAPVVPVRVGFHSGAVVSDFAMTDSEGRVLIGWNVDGVVAFPGFDSLKGLASLPKSQTEAQTPNFLWSNNGKLQTRPDWDGLYTQSASQVYSSLAEYMAYWEALRTEAPNYVTRIQLATDADSNPIWAYEFTPSPITVDVTEVDGDAVQQPQIVFVGGTHSAEKAALVTNLLFAQNLVRNWRVLPGYERIRWGCRLVMIPTIVPYGTDNNQNYNINDVDINRNGVGWDLALGEPGGAFRGPSQFSEIESQLAFDLPTTHFPEAIAFVDHHNGSGVDPDTGVDYAVWVGTIRDDGVRLAREHLADMSAWVMREMQPTLSDNQETAFLTQNNYGTNGRGWQAPTTDSDPGRDKLGYLLETATTDSFFPGNDVTKSRRMGEQNILGFLNLLLARERIRMDASLTFKI